MPLSDGDLKITKFVVDRFRETAQGTRRKALTKKFELPSALARLQSYRILRSSDNDLYWPTALAFCYSGTPDDEALARDVIERFVTALKELFRRSEDDRDAFTLAEISAKWSEMYGSPDPMIVKLGLYFADEFGFVGGWQGNANEPDALRYPISDRLVGLGDVSRAWADNTSEGKAYVEEQTSPELQRQFLVRLGSFARNTDNSVVSRDRYFQLGSDVGLQAPAVNDLLAELSGREDLRIAEPFGLLHIGPGFISKFQENTVPLEPKFSRRLEGGSISVLISHSGKDVELAKAVIELLRTGLGLVASQIRCSSVDGYRLPAGVNTDDQLRREVRNAGVLIGLLTHNSLSSTYVLFELGARWGAEQFMIPLLSGITPEEMKGPHRVLNALSCDTDEQLIQLVEDCGSALGITPQSSSSYLEKVRAIRSLSVSASLVSTDGGAQGRLATNQASFRMSFNVGGEPPSQSLKLSATEPVVISQVDYMLSDETWIATHEVSVAGRSTEIPLSYDSLLKVFNTPRVDRNYSDHSGPMKLGVTVSFQNRTKQYVLPARMQPRMANKGGVMTNYIELGGAKSFYDAP